MFWNKIFKILAPKDRKDVFLEKIRKISRKYGFDIYPVVYLVKTKNDGSWEQLTPEEEKTLMKKLENFLKQNKVRFYATFELRDLKQQNGQNPQ